MVVGLAGCGIAGDSRGVTLWAARTGLLSERGYHFLYRTVALPGEALGGGDLSVVVFYTVNCGNDVNPRRFPDSPFNRERPGAEQVIFTCREPENRLSKWVKK